MGAFFQSIMLMAAGTFVGIVLMAIVVPTDADMKKKNEACEVNLLPQRGIGDECLTGAQISEGTIIRTHDSQKLGAKYLNESDLGQGVKSREECLRLCCKTPRCNVNVFEEKSVGSCYMFDCGPPEDFRCKFTSQPQYTSAILRKPNLNQHESELSQLRTMMVDGAEGGKVNPSVPMNNNNNGNTIRVAMNNANEPSGSKQQELQEKQRETENDQIIRLMTTTTTVFPPQPPRQQPVLVDTNLQQGTEKKQTQPLQQVQGPQPPQQRRSQCGRNQFECKSSGECIAIYNVCDKISQCVDGSDESPEVGCNPLGQSVNVIKGPQSGPGIPGPMSMVPNNNNGPLSGSPVTGNGGPNGFNILNSHHPVLGQSQQEEFRLPPQPQQSAIPLLSSPSFGINNVNNGNKNEQMQQQQQQQPQALNIFSHKDAGIMEHSPYWKPPSFDYNSGGDSSSSPNNNNNNNNPYGPQVVPIINNNVGAYGGGSNNGNSNNNYGSGPSYPYPQVSQQQQQSQYVPYPNNGNNLNNLQLQSIQQQQQQQQQQLLQQQQSPYYASSNVNMNNSPGNNNNFNIGLSNNNNQNSAAFNTVNGSPRLLPLNNNAQENGAMSPYVNPQQQQQQQQSGTQFQQPQQGSPLNFPTTTTNKVQGGKTNVSFSGLAAQEFFSPATASVSFNEISKLELPQRFRKLSSQIQRFASEPENETEHSAGPGAIIAFVLGLAMSCVMVLIVGCRLRRIGTRRRGKNRLDPDFLVDGMYL